MLRNTLLLAAAVCVLTGLAHGSPTWIRNYDGVGSNSIRYVLPLSNGHTVFSATCYSPPEINGSWTAEIDENGDILWNYYNDYPPLGIAEIDSEGYMLLTGVASSCRVVRLDQSGNEVWEHPASWASAGIVATADGNFVYKNVYNLVKIDPDFNTIWDFEPPEPEAIQRLGPSYSPSGGFSAAGANMGPNLSYFAAGTADSLGVFSAVGEFDESGNVIYALGTYSDVDGNCYSVAQYDFPYPPPTSDEYVLRFDSDGELKWYREIDDLVDICQSADGHPVVVGENSLYAVTAFFIRKLDPETGSTLWNVVHGNGTDSFDPYCIATASDGGFVVGGGAWDGIAVLAKTDSEGLINGMGLEEESESCLLQIAPLSNPSSGSVLLRIAVPGISGVYISVFDASGRVVAEEERGTVNGEAVFNTGKLPTGIYSAYAFSDEFGGASCRFVVLN